MRKSFRNIPKKDEHIKTSDGAADRHIMCLRASSFDSRPSKQKGKQTYLRTRLRAAFMLAIQVGWGRKIIFLSLLTSPARSLIRWFLPEFTKVYLLQIILRLT